MSTLDSDRDLYFEYLGDDFESFMSDYDVDQRVKLIFDKLLPRQERFEACLEVGCGTGRISREAASLVGELTVTDISARLARQVGEQLKCRYRQEDATSLSFESESFDLVISSECVEHVSDPWTALSEMDRVLRPGGLLVITTPNRVWYPVLLVAQTLRLRKFAGRERWLWPHQVKGWLIDEGFEIHHFGGCHLLPWQIPGAKRILPLFDRVDESLYPLMINFGFAARKT